MAHDVDIAQALADALHARLDLFELRADDDINDDLRNGVWRGMATKAGAATGVWLDYKGNTGIGSAAE